MVGDLRADDLGRFAKQLAKLILVRDHGGVVHTSLSTGRIRVGGRGKPRAYEFLTAEISFSTESLASPNSIVVFASR